MLSNPFPWLWLAWGVAGAAIEYAAYRTRRDVERVDTLSSVFQWLFVERHALVRRLSLALFFGACLWLADHLWG